MKNKIIKSMLAVVLTCSISLSFGGCFNANVGDNLEEYFNEFFGGLFGDDDPDDDRDNDKPVKPDKDSSSSSSTSDTPDKDSSDSSASEEDTSSSTTSENNFSTSPYPDSLLDSDLLPDETYELGLTTQVYNYDECTVTLSPIQAVVRVGQSFNVLLSCDKVPNVEYEVELFGGKTHGSVEGKTVTCTATGQLIVKIIAKGLPHQSYWCYVYVVGDESEGSGDSSTGDTSDSSSSDDLGEIVDVEEVTLNDEAIYF